MEFTFTSEILNYRKPKLLINFGFFVIIFFRMWGIKYGYKKYAKRNGK